MKKFKFTINGNEYAADVLSVEDNIAEVAVNGINYTVEIDQKMQAVKTPKLVRTAAVPSTDSHPSVSKTSSPSAPKGTGNIKSPLPGVILDIFVREGDSVKIGQKLIMLEAMKMENNITAEKAGTVKEIKVAPGDSVGSGDVVVVIE